MKGAAIHDAICSFDVFSRIFAQQALTKSSRITLAFSAGFQPMIGVWINYSKVRDRMGAGVPEPFPDSNRLLPGTNLRGRQRLD
jgi:hypothetical protein